jgi:hypothetical protein
MSLDFLNELGKSTSKGLAFLHYNFVGLFEIAGTSEFTASLWPHLVRRVEELKSSPVSRLKMHFKICAFNMLPRFNIDLNLFLQCVCVLKDSQKQSLKLLLTKPL